MKAIPSCQTQVEVEKAFEIIENCNSKAAKGLLFLLIIYLPYTRHYTYLWILFYIVDWLLDKKTPWILSAISPAYTKMAPEIWNVNRNNTNVNESAHHNINIDGISLSLLAAVKK